MAEQFREKPEQSVHSREEFEIKKTKFFSTLGVQMRDAFKLHKDIGLWKKVEGKRDWGNVSEHCLVEVARARVLATKLGLGEGAVHNLETAAALHDFYKAQEKRIVTQSGLSWESFDKAAEESDTHIRQAGFSEQVARLAGSVGHTSLNETERILAQPELTEDDLSFLVLHYIDDYSVGSDWVQESDVGADGVRRNNLDRRMDANDANKRYAVLNEEGRQHFGGRTSFEAQRQIGKAVEQRLAQLLSERTGEPVDPVELPELIDKTIKAQIEEA